MDIYRCHKIVIKKEDVKIRQERCLTYFCIKYLGMAHNKADLFDEKLAATANYFKALAHPARLQILQFLAQQDSCITGDISDEIPLGRTTVNQHIKELKQIGLIQGEICGAKTKYCLNKKVVNDLKELINVYLKEISIDNNQECC